MCGSFGLVGGETTSDRRLLRVSDSRLRALGHRSKPNLASLKES